jgi:4-amino-4-deoxy-L-arabinose transferase-like glycosyltransferase
MQKNIFTPTGSVWPVDYENFLFRGHALYATFVLQMKLSLIAVLSPVLLLFAVFLITVSSGRTIVPLDIYQISHQLYQPGNAKKVHNSYMTDTLDVLLPWKFYLYEYKPAVCMTEVGSEKWGVSNISGVLLPQGFCYPLMAVRPNLFLDSLTFLSKWTSFFSAYDFSYFILLSSLFFSALFCFYFWAEGHFLGAAVPATLALTSFPVARELEHDGLILAIPYFFLALGSLIKGVKDKKAWVIVLAFAFLAIAVMRSTLQAYAILFLLFGLFAFLWLPKLDRKTLIFGLFCLVVCFAICFWWNLPAIRVFLSQAPEFIPEKGVPPLLAFVKRAVAWCFSIGHTLFGPLIFSFDTVDFYKVVGNLGARDYPSYDGSSVFLGPTITFLFLLTFTGVFKTKLSNQDKKIFKVFLLCLGIDFIVCVSPLYRLLYFRFHQWWLLLSMLLAISSFLRHERNFNIDKTKLFKSIGFALLVAIVFYLLVLVSKSFLLQKFDHQGVLGFESGTWEVRVNKWMRRIIFTDYYSVAFLAFGIAGVWLYLKKKWNLLMFVLALSGLALTTFHFNFPQKIEHFEKYRAALAVRPWSLEGPGRPMRENNMLLVNKPVAHIYESLTIRMPEATHD